VRTLRLYCSCGWIWETMTLADRVFRCEKCGLVRDRDDNAATNIENLGVRADSPEVTLGETRPAAFRYRKARPVVEPRTVLEDAHVA